MKRFWTAAALAFAACSTTMVSTWKKPGIGPLAFQKVAVIAPVKDEGIRRSIEDQVAGSVRSVEAVPGYRLGALSSDPQALRAQLAQAGFDGAVVVGIRSVNKQARVVPGAGYYGFGMYPMYDPGYVTVDTYVTVQTNIYSVADGEMLFSATSRTADPQSLRELVDETVSAVSDELRKQGLVRPVSLRDAAPAPAVAAVR
jgi:hypothetical protein